MPKDDAADAVVRGIYWCDYTGISAPLVCVQCMAEHSAEDEPEEVEDEDLDFDDLPDLPPEAGKDSGEGFEPNDEWIRTANRKLQHATMRRWFLSRYQDPAMDTPYSDGEYVYIHGGPYEAADELLGSLATSSTTPTKS